MNQIKSKQYHFIPSFGKGEYMKECYLCDSRNSIIFCSDGRFICPTCANKQNKK